ncbi:MAG: cupin domain-containing protein [Candidatus Sulfotelmatobacter sp.]
MDLDEYQSEVTTLETNNNHNKTNEDAGNKNQISRRGFLELGSAAVTGVAGVLAMTDIAAGQEQELMPGVKTGKSTHMTDPGPTDKALDTVNPDISVPPPTDAGGSPTFKYPFSFSNRRVYQGGWSREVTVRELPISKTIAGVDMRLTAGGIRELHWHTAAEWAIMLYGSARITAVDADGAASYAIHMRAISGTFRLAYPIPSRGSRPTAPSSCWCSTMARFPNTQLSCCQT